MQGFSDFLKAEGKGIDKVNAVLRFYYQFKDIDTLDDDEWAQLHNELLYVLKFNGTLTEKQND